MKVLLLAWLAAHESANACETGSFEIFYLPLNADFFVPPDPEYIKRYGVYHCVDWPNVGTLFDIVERANGTMIPNDDLSGLRIVIVRKSDAHVLYVTSDKSILTDTLKFQSENDVLESLLRQLQ